MSWKVTDFLLEVVTTTYNRESIIVTKSRVGNSGSCTPLKRRVNSKTEKISYQKKKKKKKKKKTAGATCPGLPTVARSYQDCQEPGLPTVGKIPATAHTPATDRDFTTNIRSPIKTHSTYGKCT